jgi:hypothetical protein
MTLEQLANLADVFGVLLIVASLVYVARQLRQNAEMMRAAASSGRVERDYQIVSPIIESREIAQMWEKGERDFDSLDKVDQMRMLFLERKAISLWHHDFQLRKRNVLRDADWHEHTWVIQNLGRRQTVRAAWQAFRGAYDPAFQEFMDGQFAIADHTKAAEPVAG